MEVLVRLSIAIGDDERDALEKLAQQDLRGLKDEIRFLLREALQQRGLLPVEPTQEKES